ncbi:MAG: presenilin family intramembrane aspartyl protease [Candidatus Woesearchaeota archaeon]
MKHDIKITGLLILLFFVAQLIGLLVLSHYIDIEQSAQTQQPVLRTDVYVVEPPQVNDRSYSFLFILSAVLIGTLLMFVLIRFKQVTLWKTWFFVSVVITLFIALYPLFLYIYISWWLPLVVSFVLAYYKSKQVWVHNITELFIYAGIAALFVPLLNMISAILLLIGISLYDAYAVWKSKHMIQLATFQSQSGVFAGLCIPKKGGMPKLGINNNSSQKGKPTHAILGGGDIAFSLLFAGTVFMITNSVLGAIVVVSCSTLALAGLFLFSKPHTFYPAMPFISAGCLLGYGIVLLM